MSGYNGWSNYETWRINLEAVDGMTLEDFGFDVEDLENGDAELWQVSKAIEEFVEEMVLGSVPEGIAYSLAANFLNRVDWEEIAEHIIADAKAEV